MSARRVEVEMAVSSALRQVLPWLRCPVCAGPLRAAERSLACARAHTFDVARDGHVTLRTGRAAVRRGDDRAMVEARRRFLDRGVFAPITAALVEAAGDAARVVELGAGTAHHLARVVAAREDRVGLALDLSPAALRQAARAHPRVAAVGCDLFEPLPLADAGADLALSVFAPRPLAEVHRILAPGGRLVVVAPEPDHLAELVAPLGLLRPEPEKHARLDAAAAGRFAPVERRRLAFALRLDREEVSALARMGPSARHLSADALAGRLATLAFPRSVGARLRVTVYAATTSTGRGSAR